MNGRCAFFNEIIITAQGNVSTVANQSRNISADEGPNLFYTILYVWFPLAPEENKTTTYFRTRQYRKRKLLIFTQYLPLVRMFQFLQNK